MNVTSFRTTDYGDVAALRLGKNRAKTNPISKSHTTAQKGGKQLTTLLEKCKKAGNSRPLWEP